MNTKDIKALFSSLWTGEKEEDNTEAEANAEVYETLIKLAESLATLPVAVAEYNGVKAECLRTVQHTRMLDGARSVRALRETVINQYRDQNIEFDPLPGNDTAGINPYSLMAHAAVVAVRLTAGGVNEGYTPFDDSEFVDKVKDLVTSTGYLCVIMGV